MLNKIFSIIWFGLMVWTCRVPDGYGPYVLLGFNAGDFAMTLWCGCSDGYLEEEGDFNLGSFLMIALAFGLLGGFYYGNLSFIPGSDAYNNAVYFVFASFLLAFGYRFFQFGLIHVLRR
jgi:hypothetical protein